MKYILGSAALAASFFIFVNGSEGQSALRRLDVFGITLGMTVQQARAQLENYRPGILMATSYLTENKQWWSGYGIRPQTDAGMGSVHPYHDAAIHIPVDVIAGKIDHAWVEHPQFASADKETPIDQFSGEFFRLFFTPTDRGGKLYSITRHRVYFSDESKELPFFRKAGIEMPTLSDVESELESRYGRPAASPLTARTKSLIWMFDSAGRPVSADSPEFGRCTSTLEGLDGATMPNPLMRAMPRSGYHTSVWWSAKKSGNVTMRELEVAFTFKDREFFTLGYGDTKTSLDDDILKFAHLVPGPVSVNRLPPQRFQPDASYRGCGVQLRAVIRTLFDPQESPNYALTVTTSLSDQSAVFFNDGVLDYMNKQLAKLRTDYAPPGPKDERLSH